MTVELQSSLDFIGYQPELSAREAVHRFFHDLVKSAPQGTMVQVTVRFETESKVYRLSVEMISVAGPFMASITGASEAQTVEWMEDRLKNQRSRWAEWLRRRESNEGS